MSFISAMEEDIPPAWVLLVVLGLEDARGYVPRHVRRMTLAGAHAVIEKLETPLARPVHVCTERFPKLCHGCSEELEIFELH